MFVRGIRPVTSLSPIFYKRPVPSDSHSLNVERAVIAQNGGISNPRLNGPDGASRFSGRPMEVKYATKGRWRIGRIDHDLMMKRNGMYILVNQHGQQLKMPAADLDRYIRYKWLSDIRDLPSGKRDFQHAFIYSKDINGF